MSRWLTGLAALGVLLAGVTWGLLENREGLAQEKARDLPPDLASIPTNWEAMVSFQVADMWDSKFGKSIRKSLGKDADFIHSTLEKSLGLPLKDIERVTVVQHLLHSGGVGLVFIQAQKTIDRKAFLARQVPDATEKTYSGKSYFVNKDSKAALVLGDKTIALGQSAEIQTLIDSLKAKREGGIAPVIAKAAGKHLVVAGIHPKSIADMADRLPPDAEPFKPLIHMTAGIITIDVSDAARATLDLRFDSPEKAKEGAKAVEITRKLLSSRLENGMKELAKDKNAGELVTLLEDVKSNLDKAPLKQSGSTLTASASVKISGEKLGSVGVAMVRKMRIAAARMQSANNLKQIGLAMHNYHSVHNTFPPAAIYDKDGKPLLSWRVVLLPYVENDNLYKKFKLDEPWDSAHNKKLLENMPKVFASPVGNPKANHTFYQAFVGKGAAFEGKRGIKVTDFGDGTSNTLMVAEAGTAVPWTKPDDIAFDADKAVPKLGGMFEEGFQGLLGDGSVRFFSKSISEKTLKAVITRNGGEVLEKTSENRLFLVASRFPTLSMRSVKNRQVGKWLATTA